MIKSAIMIISRVFRASAFILLAAFTPNGQEKAPLEKMPDSVMEADLLSLDGKSLKLSENKGKIVVLSLWATWCGPCRYSMPDLNTVAKEFAGRGVGVIALTTEDPQEDLEKVEGFAIEYKLTYRIGWIGSEMVKAISPDSSLLPQIFIVLPDGRITERFIGFKPETSPARLREAVEQALIHMHKR